MIILHMVFGYSRTIALKHLNALQIGPIYIYIYSGKNKSVFVMFLTLTLGIQWEGSGINCMIVTCVDVCILYFIWWILHPIHYIKIAELDCCQIYIYTMCLSPRFALRDKVTIYFNISDVAEWSRALDMRVNAWWYNIVYQWCEFKSGPDN